MKRSRFSFVLHIFSGPRRRYGGGQEGVGVQTPSHPQGSPGEGRALETSFPWSLSELSKDVFRWPVVFSFLDRSPISASEAECLTLLRQLALPLIGWYGTLNAETDHWHSSRGWEYVGSIDFVGCVASRRYLI